MYSFIVLSTQVSAVEEKVAALIISNQISARIDSTNATLHAKHTEQRGVSCRKVLVVFTSPTYQQRVAFFTVTRSLDGGGYHAVSFSGEVRDSITRTRYQHIFRESLTKNFLLRISAGPSLRAV